MVEEVVLHVYYASKYLKRDTCRHASLHRLSTPHHSGVSGVAALPQLVVSQSTGITRLGDLPAEDRGRRGSCEGWKGMVEEGRPMCITLQNI